MSCAFDKMLPGEHPHSDRPNWRPAETVEEYLLNVREGLEKHSVERMTKLLDMNRTHAWRARQLTYIPEVLFGRLARAGIRTRQLAQIGLAFARDGNQPAEIERCPHCREVIRVRWLIGRRAQKVIQQWIDDGMPDAPEQPDEPTTAVVTIDGGMASS